MFIAVEAKFDRLSFSINNSCLFSDGNFVHLKDNKVFECQHAECQHSASASATGM